ncbi:septum formation family protein [Nocardiopsis halophila]|uniref:septum formation family protein n=1 Tax=Nocardiopsis halophila TaxID=141692 RepID=UPI00034D29AA|nr:septum formation family protein [Nocardiopsis halophila]
MPVRFAPAAQRTVAALALAGAALTASGCGTILANLEEAADRAAREQGSDTAPPESAAPAEEPEEDAPASSPPPAEEEDVAAFDISVGDCLNDETLEGEVSEVPKVDCAQPHDSEVYAATVSSEPEWPGEQGILDEAQEFCQEEFASFIGVPFDQQTDYEFSFYTPTRGAFEDLDRDISCVVFEPGAQTTGTLRGAGA